VRKAAKTELASVEIIAYYLDRGFGSDHTAQTVD
jgi:hypothetical protein